MPREITTIATTLGLAAAALAAGAIWNWRTKRIPQTSPKPWSIRATAFQSDISFSEAKNLLIGGNHGPWYERDSAWYNELLTRSSVDGVRLNLYRFEKKWVLELKADSPSANRAAAEAYASNTLLPALKARDPHPTAPVN